MSKERDKLFRAVERYIKKHYEAENDFPIIGLDMGGFDRIGSRGLGTPTDAVPKPGRALRGILDALLKMTDKTFTEKLMGLIKKNGNKASDIYIKAGITRQHFSKIKSHADYQPSKETALAFAVVLHLSLDETLESLKPTEPAHTV